MDKHEIREKSRKENRGGDEREAQITAKAWQLGAAVGILICGIAMTVFGLVFDEPMKYMADNMMIYFGMIATVYTYKAVKLKTRLDIMFASLFWVFFGCFTAIFVVSFSG